MRWRRGDLSAAIASVSFAPNLIELQKWVDKADRKLVALLEGGRGKVPGPPLGEKLPPGAQSGGRRQSAEPKPDDAERRDGKLPS